jgi:hypothetical protein
MEGKTKKKRVEKRIGRKKKDSIAVTTHSETPKEKKKGGKKRSLAVKKKAGPLTPTHEQVQLRAYFISEQRRLNGISGDEHSDWLRAEKELREELLAEKSSLRD